jgi:hypothetical protein
MARLLSVSIPDDLAAEAEALAVASGKTKSEVVRDARVTPRVLCDTDVLVSAFIAAGPPSRSQATPTTT